MYVYVRCVCHLLFLLPSSRYTFSDESLPAWFADEEKHYVKRQMPITKVSVTY